MRLINFSLEVMKLNMNQVHYMKIKLKMGNSGRNGGGITHLEHLLNLAMKLQILLLVRLFMMVQLVVRFLVEALTMKKAKSLTTNQFQKLQTETYEKKNILAYIIGLMNMISWNDLKYYSYNTLEENI